MKQEELDQLIAEHERWIDDRSVGTSLKLVDEDLRGLDLSGHWLSRAHFENVDLTGANLQKTRVVGAIITKVKFCEANMAQVDLSESEINDTDFTNANLTGLQIHSLVNANNVKFDGAVMDEAFFVKSTFGNSSFKNASLKSANFKRAYFDKCSLQGANFKGADFTRTYLVDVDLRESNVENANFERTRMGPIKVYGIIGKPSMVESCSAVDVDFSESGDKSDIREVEDERSIFMQALSA